MRHQVALRMLATWVATTSTLYAQPGTGEDAPPPDTASPPPPPVMPSLPPPPPPSAVAEPEPSPPETVATGIAVEIRLDTTQVLVENDFALPGIGAGLFVGHRGRGLTIGVGVDVTRINESQSGGGSSNDQSATSFLVIPGVRFVLARSGDTKTELLGQADAGYGLTLRRSDSNMGTNPPNIHRLRVQAGPSLRHWLTPSFAVGGTAGLRYERWSVSSDNGMGMSSDSSIATTSLFASLQMTGVF